MSKAKEELHYEEAAEPATATGWTCKKCRRFWKEEHMARYCCSTDSLCGGCGERCEKHYIKCRKCRDAEEHKKWFAKPAIEWDGEFPIALWSSDEFFFNEDDLIEYIENNLMTEEEQPSDLLTDDLWLTTCSENRGREFIMSEFLEDDLCEESDLDENEINKTVNDWIEAHAPFSWSMTGKRLSVESVKKQILSND